MKTPEDIFKINAKYYSNLFSLVADNGIVDARSFQIDCNNLSPIYRPKQENGIDVRTAAPFKEMFEWLRLYDAFPCLYRWEILSPTILSTELVNTIKSQLKEIKDTTPTQTPRVTKSAFPKDNTLYVGKSESIVDRTIKHLGYHTHRDMHGLHLDDWANLLKWNSLSVLWQRFIPRSSEFIISCFKNSASRTSHFRSVRDPFTPHIRSVYEPFTGHYQE